MKSSFNKNHTNKQRHQSVLALNSSIPSVFPHEVEGEDYLNIARDSKSIIGQKLAPGYPAKFKTIFGTIGNMRAVMQFLVTPGYPIDLLKNEVISKNDARRIPEERVFVPNYWALVAYLMCERVKSDKVLKAALQQQKFDRITCYTGFNEGELFGKSVSISAPNVKMGKYLAIIREIIRMIKHGIFNDENIKTFIEDAKDFPEKDLFEGLDHIMIRITEKDLLGEKDTDGLPNEDELDAEAAALEYDAEGEDGHFTHVTESEGTPVDEVEEVTDETILTMGAEHSRDEMVASTETEPVAE